MESRVFSSDLMKRFISCYKENTSLWKVGSKEYTNRSLKKKAYEKLVMVVREKYPDADKEYIVRKINSIRSCFRKEHKKVLNSRRMFPNSTSVYKPSLWYYDLLLFTADKDFETDEGYEYDVDVKKESQNYHTESADPLSMCMPSYKPTRVETSDISVNLMPTTHYEPSQKEDEYDAYGITVAAKLRKMTEHQRLFSENLINQVLFKGMFNKLSENTVLYECNITPEQNMEIMSTICSNNI